MLAVWCVHSLDLSTRRQTAAGFWGVAGGKRKHLLNLIQYTKLDLVAMNLVGYKGWGQWDVYLVLVCLLLLNPVLVGNH